MPSEPFHQSSITPGTTWILRCDECYQQVTPDYRGVEANVVAQHGAASVGLQPDNTEKCLHHSGAASINQMSA